jgi:hypothetical protein
MNEGSTIGTDPATGPAAGGAGGPSFRGPGVETEGPRGGVLPGLLRFFVVPLVLVGASLAVFAGLGAVVGRGPPEAADLVARISTGGKNARWQAAQDLSNRVHRGEVDLRRDVRLAEAVAAAFSRARAEGDDPRVLQHLAVLLGRAAPAVGGPALAEALADGNPDVRVFVAAALGQAGDPGRLATLLPALGDPDAGVRAVAAFSCGALAEAAGPEGREAGAAALLPGLADPELDVRWNAALALARLGRPEAADTVWSMLHRDYVRRNLRGEAPGGGLLAPGGTDPAGPADREEAVVLNALSAAWRLRDRSMADGVRALAAGDPSDAVRDWAMRTASALEEEARARGPVSQRTWTAAR